MTLTPPHPSTVERSALFGVGNDLSTGITEHRGARSSLIRETTTRHNGYPRTRPLVRGSHPICSAVAPSSPSRAHPPPRPPFSSPVPTSSSSVRLMRTNRGLAGGFSAVTICVGGQPGGDQVPGVPGKFAFNYNLPLEGQTRLLRPNGRAVLNYSSIFYGRKSGRGCPEGRLHGCYVSRRPKAQERG